jgi:basic amino acid/polyamine antiporter, APA family
MWKNLFRTKNIDKIIADADAESAHGGGLKRVLTLKDLTFFGIAAIIGAGSFSSLGEAIFRGGPGVMILFIICGVACAFTAMCYAEFASRIPVAGSAYTYAYASFGELFAWIIGWALIMEYSIGNIYVAYSWSDYFTSFLSRLNVHLPDYITSSYMEVKKAIADGTTKPEYLNAWKNAPNVLGFKFIADIPAFIINILITYLVYIGVKESRNFSNAMVILKLAVVILVILVGAQYIFSDNWFPKNADGVKTFMPNGFSGVMSAVSGVFFAYIGFDAISVMAEESKNPQRDLPRSMILSLVICTVVYILLTLVLTGALNYKDYEGVGDPLAKIFEANGNGWMQFLVSICAIVAITSVLLVFQLGQPRIWMSMSRDGLMPKKFNEIHPKYQTPKFATIMTGLVVGIPLLFTDRGFILDFTSIGTLFAFVLVCGGVLLLPKKEKVKGKFNMPYVNGKILFPLLLVGSMVLIGLNNKDYFPDLLKLGLTTEERAKEINQSLETSLQDIGANFLSNANAKELFRTRTLKATAISTKVDKQVAFNEKIVGWTKQLLITQTGKKDALTSFLNGVDTLVKSETVVFANIDYEMVIRSLQDSIHSIPKASLLGFKDTAALKTSTYWDTTLNRMLIHQLEWNAIVKADTIDTNQLKKLTLTNEILASNAKVTIASLQSDLDKASLSKKTTNISMLIFWLIGILLSIFAILKNWSLIPMLGLISCLYLLTGMAANNWKWFAIWFAIGLVIYALYGYKKSKLAK